MIVYDVVVLYILSSKTMFVNAIKQIYILNIKINIPIREYVMKLQLCPGNDNQVLTSILPANWQTKYNTTPVLYVLVELASSKLTCNFNGLY